LQKAVFDEDRFLHFPFLGDPPLDCLPALLKTAHLLKTIVPNEQFCAWSIQNTLIEFS
jgi:hypothetical protein